MKMDIGTVILLIVIGLAAGIFGGMVGLGGGVIMIPAMVYLLGMSQHSAQGTSLAVMLPPIGILAVMNYYRAGQVNLYYALIIATAFIIGGYFGSRIALNIPVTTMRRIFAVILILLSLQMLLRK